MNRLIMQAVLLTILSPLAVAQSESTVLLNGSEPAASAAHEASDVSQLSSTGERMKAMKNARTVCIHSETVFLTVSTLERALMKQKDWDRLGLTIVGRGEGCSADLEINVDQASLHSHPYLCPHRRAHGDCSCCGPREGHRWSGRFGTHGRTPGENTLRCPAAGDGLK